MNMIKDVYNAQNQYISTKYVTAYDNADRDNTSSAIIHALAKVGDATKDVRRLSSNTNWFNDNSVGVAYTVPYFGRGGGSGEEIYSGIFYSDSTSGGAYDAVGFRLSLAK